MALEIKGLQRIFKFKKDSKELVLSDPNNELSVNEVMDFYSMTYPELTTATVHGPEWEEDKAVYRFKTTIGVKDKRMGKRKKKEDKPCRLLSESAKENLAGLIIRSAGPSDIRRGTAGQKRRILPPPGSVMIF